MKREQATGDHYYSRAPTAQPRVEVIRAHLRGRWYEFLTASSVFSKTRIDLGTRLLIESMQLPETGWTLDLGCGYGPVGIVAASLRPGAQVMMTDVNTRAVGLARANAKRNQVRNATVRHGPLYTPVGAMVFDTILCNPPMTAGANTVHAILSGAPEHLATGGSLQLVVRSTKGGTHLSRVLDAVFGNVAVLARQSGYRVLRSKKP